MTTATSGAAAVDLDAGLPDPVRDSQAAFRLILDAMANPGRIAAFPALVKPRDRLGPTAAAVCLALVDYETTLWLDPTLASPSAAGYLRFHCGAPTASGPETADFAVLDGASTRLDRFKTGTDAYPEEGTTVIIQVPDLSATGPLVLSGPGIDGERQLGIEGLPDSFWSERAAINNYFPRGLDLILCTAGHIAALPRTTRVRLPASEEDR